MSNPLIEVADSHNALPKFSAIKPEHVENYLGPIKYFSEVSERCEKPGVVIGLAWSISTGLAGFWKGLPFWIIVIFCLYLLIVDSIRSINKSNQ